MKKIVVFFLTIALAFATVTVHAQETSVTLTGPARIKAGRTVEIVLTVSATHELFGFSGTLTTEASKWTLLSFEALPQGWIVETGNNGHFIAYDNTPSMNAPLTGTQDLARLTFAVENGLSAGEELTVALSMEDELGTVLETNFTVTVLAEDQAICGDVNEDGFVNAKDRMILSRYLADWDISSYTFDANAADVDGDGAITALDRAILARFLAGWGEPYASYFS